jgi:hypothetical protein
VMVRFVGSWSFPLYDRGENNGYFEDLFT